MTVKRSLHASSIFKPCAIGLVATSFIFLSSQAADAQRSNLPPGGSTAGSFGGSSGTPTTTPSTAPSSGTSAPANNSGINQVLAMYGLIPTACNVGVVQVMVSIEQSVCAYPTSQYPSGTYFLNQQDFSLRPLGVPQPPVVPTPVPTPVVMPTPQPTVPPIYGPQGTTPGAVINLPPTGMSIVVIGSPGQTVPPDISAQISASMAARGLTLVSCSANPPVTVTTGQYMACANSTATYPAGRYVIR